MNNKPFGTSLAPYVRAASIGAAAGLRSLSPPAAVFQSSNRWRTILTILAAGEIIGDKFPQAPSRLFAPVLVWRVFVGGMCGGEIARREKAGRAMGIVAGSLAAIASSYGGYALRMELTEKRNFPGFPAAAAEDAVTLLLVRFATRGS